MWITSHGNVWQFILRRPLSHQCLSYIWKWQAASQPKLPVVQQMDFISFRSHLEAIHHLKKEKKRERENRSLPVVFLGQQVPHLPAGSRSPLRFLSLSRPTSWQPVDLHLPAGRGPATLVYPAASSAQVMWIVLSRERRTASPPSDQLSGCKDGRSHCGLTCCFANSCLQAKKSFSRSAPPRVITILYSLHWLPVSLGFIWRF